MNGTFESTDTDIHHVQTDRLYNRVVFSSIGYLFAALMMLLLVESASNYQAIWLWFSVICVVSLVRYCTSIIYFKQKTAESSLIKWRFRFHGATYLAAITWGLSMWVFFPLGEAQDKFVMILILGGVAGGALSTLSYDKFLVTVFLSILLIGIESFLLWHDDLFNQTMAIIVPIYFVFLIKAANDIGKSYEELLKLKADAEIHNLTLLSTAEKIAKIGYWQWDLQSKIMELSPNLMSMCSVDDKHISFGDTLCLIHEDDRDRVRASIDSVCETGVEDSIEFRLHGQNNDFLIINQTARRITETSGKSFILGAVQDISLIKSVQQTMFDMAYTDDLTELANRGYFQQYLPERIRHAIRNQQQLAILYIDLNRFKRINDILGHEQGNLFLSVFSTRLKRLFRDSDFIARIGGDEFCVVMSDVTEGAEIAQAAERCLALELEPIKIDNQDFLPNMSIGIAIHPQDGLDSDTLIRAADAAMYKVKHSDKQHFYAFYDPQMTKDAASRLELETDLKKAVKENEFKLVYQPKVSLIDGQIYGVEALIRWAHPVRGMVFPDEFILTAERIGLINEIGEWVLKTACEQLKNWKSQGINLEMAINISASHYSSENFLKNVIETKKQYMLKDNELEIEITESVSRDAEKYIEVCKELRKNGIKVAIDDFGTGYSSLSVLSQLEIDTLKIDRAFIQHIPNDDASIMMVSTILRMAGGLNLDVVAEGVESFAQAKFLKKAGCTLAQGYYFSRPVEAEKITLLAKTVFQDVVAVQTPNQLI